MKKIYLLIMALMPLFVWAQPTISNMFVMPVGSSYTILMDSTLGVSSGGSGANQTWNYGSVIPTIPNNSQTGTSETPSSANFATDSFPTATIVINNANTQYAYYNTIGGGEYMVGLYQPAASLFVYYQNSEQQTQVPITYTNTFTDIFARHYTVSGYMTDGSGSVTATADAYGNITTPVGTYNNCLRIKIHQTDNDTFLFSSTITTTDTYSWLWFDGTHFAPVFRIDSVVSALGGSYTAGHLTNSSAGINEVSQNKIIAMVFPNPSNGQFTFCYNLNSPTAILQIKDLSGRLVYQETISGTIGNKIINTNDLNNGMYIWQIINTEGTQASGKLKVTK
jgi:type IX secretion system substrate protein